MNEPVRIVADWLNGTTSGAVSVNDVLVDVPRDAGDDVPDDLTFYDASRHGFAARGVFPTKDGTVTYPCCVTRLVEAGYVFERRYASDARELPGEVTVAVILAILDSDSDTGVQDLGYLVRAAHGSLMQLHEVAAIDARTRNGYRLTHPTAVRIQPFRPEKEDAVIATAILCTYTTDEATPN